MDLTHEEKKKRKHRSEAEGSADKKLLKKARKLLAKQLDGAGGSHKHQKKSHKHKSHSKRSKRSASPSPPPAIPAPTHITRISAADYYEKNAEFSAWMASKGRNVQDLDSATQHSNFDSFAEAWNSRLLPGEYYSGGMKAPKRRTAYRWGIADSGDAPGPSSLGVAAAMDDDADQAAQDRSQGRAAVQAGRAQWRQQQKDVLDELLPKETGREAKLDKVKARRETEAAARDASPEPINVDIMGGGDSFQAALARQKQRQGWKDRGKVAKAEVLSHKLEAARSKEAEKMDMFRSLLENGPITIQKRS